MKPHAQKFWPSCNELPPISEEDRGATLTQAEIAERLGMSKARVGQIERRAMTKLRKLAEKRGIRLEDLLGP